MGSEPLAALEKALQAIAPYGRGDLEERLRQTGFRLRAGRVRVLVVGEFKQGKSLLVNGLVRAPVCPVFDDVATSVPTVVRLRREPHRRRWSGCSSRPTTAIPSGRRPNGSSCRSRSWPSTSRRPATRATGRAGGEAEIGLPRALLAGGLEIVDTPGVGGLNSVHGAATMAALPAADAVLFVSDASQEYTAPELEFLRQASKVCPNVACVLSKADLYPEWERIAELDRGHLADREDRRRPARGVLRPAGARDPRRRRRGRRRESGFPALVSLPARAGRRPGRPARPPVDRARHRRGDRAARPPRCWPSGPATPTRSRPSR